ncbi:ERCC1/RAD10/SWI10 family, partial [Trinorchestia longiramus]
MSCQNKAQTSGGEEIGANSSSATGSSCNFASAFGALKDSSAYAAAQNVPAADPKNLPPPGRLPSKNSIIVSSRQRGNPLLKHIRNVPHEFGEIVADYVMGTTTCAVFLSMRYHRLNPQYIHERLKVLGQQYQLRVLLLQ